MFETGAGNADVISVLRGIGGARATSLSTTVYRALPNDTDLSELMVLGKPAMNFAFIGGVERYHTAEDDVAHLSPGSVQHHGNQALALARAFASGPLPRPQSADAVFFDFPILGVVAYPEWFAVAAGIVTLILVLLGIVQLRRAGSAAVKDAALGAIAFILSLLIAVGAAFGLASLLAAWHANVGGAPQWRGIYAAAAVFLVAAIVFATYAVARRAATAQGLGMGALLVIAVAALLAAIALPGVSFLLGWPAFFAASAAVGGTLVARGLIGVGKQWVAAVVTMFLMVPTIYLMVCVALGLDAVGAVALGALTVISLWLLAPQLEIMLGKSRWRPAAIAAAIAVLLTVAGALTVRTTARRPAGVSVVYAVNADSQTAWFAGGGTTPAVRTWVATAAATLPRQPAALQPPAWLTRMYPASRIAQLPMTPTAAPSAEVMRDTAAGGERVVTLRVRGGAGARSVQVTAPPGTIASMKVDGREVDRSRYRSRSAAMSLEYISPPDSGFLLELTLPTSGSAELGLMARHARQGTPPEIAMPTPPEGTIPIQSGNATLVYKTVLLTQAASQASIRKK
jgi:Peptidase family M28